jgi:hypothetical protein
MKKRGGSTSIPASVSIVTKTTIIGTIISFIRGIGSFLFNMAILSQAIFVLIMCCVVYMMMHFTLVAINFMITLIRTILPFLKKKLKLLPVWPHILVLNALGISFDDEDDDDDDDDKNNKDDNYCPA